MTGSSGHSVDGRQGDEQLIGEERNKNALFEGIIKVYHFSPHTGLTVKLQNCNKPIYTQGSVRQDPARIITPSRRQFGLGAERLRFNLGFLLHLLSIYTIFTKRAF